MDKETEDLIPKCFYCHTPLIWQTDEMAQDLYEDYEVYIKTSTNKK